MSVLSLSIVLLVCLMIAPGESGKQPEGFVSTGFMGTNSKGGVKLCDTD